MTQSYRASGLLRGSQLPKREAFCMFSFSKIIRILSVTVTVLTVIVAVSATSVSATPWRHDSIYLDQKASTTRAHSRRACSVDTQADNSGRQPRRSAKRKRKYRLPSTSTLRRTTDAPASASASAATIGLQLQPRSLDSRTGHA